MFKITNTNSKFTKEHTQLVKGIAIILMLAHHLFAFSNGIEADKYISVMQIGSKNIEMIFGQFSKICVGIYLFLSGYGLWYISERKKSFGFKDSIKYIKKIYLNYLIVFIIFIPIGFIFFEKQFIFNEFILNLVGLSSSYNGSWWFFRLYIQLILIFPILKKILGENLFYGLYKTIFIFFLALASKLIFKITPQLEFISKNIIYLEMYVLLRWQIFFSIGYLSAKFDLYYKIKRIIINKKLDHRWLYTLIMIFILILRQSLPGGSLPGGSIIDFIFIPIFILVGVNSLFGSKLHTILMHLGKHSTNMWLIHNFFYQIYFEELVFFPKISVLVLIWLVLLSLMSSYLIDYILKIILNNRCNKIKI